MIITSFCLVFFNDRTNQFLPLILVVISFISFEFVNLFYNLSLYKVRKKNNEGAISNLGWAFGYLGGLISLLLIYLLLTIFQKYDFIIFGLSAFLLIGPFVALWSAYFGSFHFKNFQSTNFHIPNVVDLIDNIKSSGITTFLISYFFFNNAVISIFAFASMFAAFLFGLSELQILFLGVFINLFGIFGCLIIGSFEDKIGSENTVKICVLGLLITTLTLFFIKSIHWFWILALIIGFFVGPIQASSRSVLVKKIKAKNQLSAFCVFSMFGNLCAILGPFVVGITVDITGSIRDGILVIPIFFCLSLFPYMRRR
jgi:UMF1 family MFS transporter